MSDPDNPFTPSANNHSNRRRHNRRQRHSAVHESGHIVACLTFDIMFSSADIRGDKEIVGRVAVDFSDVPLDEQVITLLAGSAAERLLIPRGRTIADWLSSRADIQECEMAIYEAHPEWGEDETTTYLKRMRARAERIILDKKDAVLAIAGALLRRGNLTAEDIGEVVKGLGVSA